MASSKKDVAFGERLKKEREAKGWTQTELGKYANVTKATVSKWERGSTKNMRPIHLFAIADAFEMDARLLALGEPEPSTRSGGYVVHDRPLPTDAEAVALAFDVLPPNIKPAVRAVVETLSRGSGKLK